MRILIKPRLHLFLRHHAGLDEALKGLAVHLVDEPRGFLVGGGVVQNVLHKVDLGSRPRHRVTGEGGVLGCDDFSGDGVFGEDDGAVLVRLHQACVDHRLALGHIQRIEVVAERVVVAVVLGENLVDAVDVISLQLLALIADAPGFVLDDGLYVEPVVCLVLGDVRHHGAVPPEDRGLRVDEAFLCPLEEAAPAVLGDLGAFTPLLPGHTLHLACHKGGRRLGGGKLEADVRVGLGGAKLEQG